MSVLCHFRTHAPQQLRCYSITSSATTNMRHSEAKHPVGRQELGPRYALWDGPITPFTTMAAMPASTALAIGDVRMSVIGLDSDACSCG